METKPERLWQAVGHQGSKHVYRSTSPRAGLLKACGATHAQPIYRDRKDGTTEQTGWIVRGEWFDVFELLSLREAKEARLPGETIAQD